MIKFFAAVSLLIALPAAANSHPEKTASTNQGSPMSSMDHGAMMKAMNGCKSMAGMTHDQMMKLGHDKMMEAMQECQKAKAGTDAHAGHPASSSVPKAEPQTPHQH